MKHLLFMLLLQAIMPVGMPYEVIDTLPDRDAGVYYLAKVEDETARGKLLRILEPLWTSADKSVMLIRIEDREVLEQVNSLPVELKKITDRDNRAALPKEDLPWAGRDKPGFRSDTLIQHMADMVSLDTMMTIIQRLQQFRTRYSSTDSARACAAWIRNKFIAYGFDSVYAETFNISYAPTVVAVKKGAVYSGRNYVVECCHYDCTSQTPTTYAPGADDNGSGAAAVLEAARVLNNYQFEHGIRLIAFSGEEQGLLGSAFYAQQASSQGDTILGAVNLDMFAYTTPGRDTLMIINDTTYMDNLWLAQISAACADSYTTLKYRVWTGLRPFSDHASFSSYGYSAVQSRENLAISNPYYHTTGDTIGGGFNAYTMCFEGIRAALATVATLAVPYVQTGDEESGHSPSSPFPGSGLTVCGPTIFPGGGNIQLILLQAPRGIIKINIYNASGRRVFTSTRHLRDGDPALISIKPDPALADGVHFLKITSPDGRIHTKKIVVVP